MRAARSLGSGYSVRMCYSAQILADYRKYVRQFGAAVDEAQVWLGEQAKVPLTVAKDFVVTVPRKSRKDMKVTVTYDQPVAAPIKKGQQLGKIVVTVPDTEPAEAPLIAAADVERTGPFGRLATVAGHMIWGSWN